MIAALLVLVVALTASALYEGAETGFYGTNRLRLRYASRTSATAAVLARVVSSPAGFLVTLLVGANIAHDAAVNAAIRVLEDLGVPQAELWSAVCLTPLMFVFCQLLPKQWALAHPFPRLLAITYPLAVTRVLLWPVTAPVVQLARLLEGRDSDDLLARQQLEALLSEGREQAPGEARVMAAALRALESRGKGLGPFLRTDLPRLGPGADLEEARRATARARDGMVLVERPDAPTPALLTARALVDAPAETRPEDLADPLLALRGDPDLSAALVHMRAHGVAHAWAPDGLCDLEYALSLLLAPKPQDP